MDFFVVPEHVIKLSFFRTLVLAFLLVVRMTDWCLVSHNSNAISSEKFSLTPYLMLLSSITISDQSLIHYLTSYSSQHFSLSEGILIIFPLSGNSMGRKDFPVHGYSSKVQDSTWSVVDIL